MESAGAGVVHFGFFYLSEMNLLLAGTIFSKMGHFVKIEYSLKIVTLRYINMWIFALILM